jgi:hypothetical protein
MACSVAVALAALSYAATLDSFIAAPPTVSFATIFRGIPVLQMNEAVNVWGNTSARSGASVVISLNGAAVASTKVTSTPSKFGGLEWSATLPAATKRSWSSTLTVMVRIFFPFQLVLDSQHKCIELIILYCTGFERR